MIRATGSFGGERLVAIVCVSGEELQPARALASKEEISAASHSE